MFASKAEQRRAEALRAEAFHKHLDACFQCANHPHDLCPVGHILLLACASENKQ